MAKRGKVTRERVNRRKLAVLRYCRNECYVEVVRVMQVPDLEVHEGQWSLNGCGPVPVGKGHIHYCPRGREGRPGLVIGVYNTARLTDLNNLVADVLEAVGPEDRYPG